MDPFAGANGTPDGDPFAAPAAVGDFPKLEAMRGRLLMFQPTKLETGLVSPKYSKPNQPHIYDRITTTVFVLDGGPVRAEDGSVFEGSEFTDMYLSQTRIISQLKKSVNRTMVLGRLDTMVPGKEAKQGNPWGLADPTEQDKAAARAYIAAGNRQPGEPFQTAPSGSPFDQPQAAPAPVPTSDPWSQQAAPAAGPGWGQPAPAPVPAGMVDPFAQ